MTKEYKKTLLIDLDGVLNQYEGNFDRDFIPNVKFGAREFLKDLSTDFEIKIFTTRNKLLCAKWLIENGLDGFVSDVTNVKDPAFLHVDDRCVCLEGNFDDAIRQIRSFKAFWKN